MGFFLMTLLSFATLRLLLRHIVLIYGAARTLTTQAGDAGAAMSRGQGVIRKSQWVIGIFMGFN